MNDLEGWRTFDKLIISILAHKTAEERKYLRQRYAETYGEDLLETFDSEANGGFERFVVSWMHDSAEGDAHLASRAIRSGSYAILIEKASNTGSWQNLHIMLDTRSRWKRTWLTTQLGDFLRATIKCLTCPEKYFEKVLRVALTAERRHEEALVRVLSMRAKVEMKLVDEEYWRKNGAPSILAMKCFRH
ncbi:hypothetical protein NL676_026161 [Syzygium grande]|nr:hypothetical protein NL676_026161 [Syzygium grande]